MKLVISTVYNCNKLILINNDIVYSFNLQNTSINNNIGDSLVYNIKTFLNQHSVSLLAIDQIYSFLGPTLFSSVRLGIVVSNTLAVSLNKPVFGINNIDFLLSYAYKYITNNNLKTTTVVVLLNIGKSGAIITINKLNGLNILPTQYLDAEEIQNYFLQNSNEEFLVIGDKTELLLNIKNCHIINENIFNNVEYIVNYIKKCYNIESNMANNNLKNLVLLKPIYIKEPDVKIKQELLKN